MDQPPFSPRERGSPQAYAVAECKNRCKKLARKDVLGNILKMSLVYVVVSQQCVMFS